MDLAPDKMVDALVGGEVDAINTYPSYTKVAEEKLGENAVVLYELGLYTITWNNVTVRDFVTRNPGIVERVLRAIVKANRFIAENQGEARAIAAKTSGIAIGILSRDWADHAMTATLDQSLILSMEDQARWMIKIDNKDKKNPDFFDIIYADGLNAVEPDAVRIAGK